MSKLDAHLENSNVSRHERTLLASEEHDGFVYRMWEVSNEEHAVLRARSECVDGIWRVKADPNG